MRNGQNGQGSNSAHLRQFHERVILSLLRRLGPASKADLARHASLTNTTAGVIVQLLETENLIRVEGKRTGGRGQPATLLTLNPEGAFSIGVKIGRRSVDTIVVDFMGRVLHQRRREQAFPLPEEAVVMVVEDVAAVRAELAGVGEARLAGLGIATPYNMGSWRRELDIPSDAYLAWNDFDIGGRLGAATGLQSLTENDGTAAAVAELFQGRGREFEHFLYLFIGSAIGGGVVIGGDYHRGARGNAGDIGLMPVPASGLTTAPAPSRRFDILLTRASVNSLIRHLRGSGVRVTTRDELDAAIEAHPETVAEWEEDCADALVGPLLAAACILDGEAVVLDGDLPRPVLERLVGRLRTLSRASQPEAREATPIVLGQVGRQAAAIGAAILPLHLNYSPNREILLGQELAG